VHEFVEECRVEWRRLGVPDPIANEMAADLTADIEEAEAEGGSAEDVLGDSVFDPRRFAASWAGACGVTNPERAGSAPRRWPILAVTAAAFFALLTLGAAVLLLGHRSASAAISVRRILGPVRPTGSAPVPSHPRCGPSSRVHPSPWATRSAWRSPSWLCCSSALRPLRSWSGTGLLGPDATPGDGSGDPTTQRARRRFDDGHGAQQQAPAAVNRQSR